MSMHNENTVFPFLWMRGEAAAVLREEIGRIAQCGIDALCVESRPHPDFLGDGWWRDLDIVMEEAAVRGMRVWILDDSHFPTGYANGAVKTHPELGKQYVYCAHADAVGPLVHAALDCAALMQKELTWRDLVYKPALPPLIQENRLLSVTARRMAGGETLAAEAADLTEQVMDGRLIFDLPAGQWRISVCYVTRDGGGDPIYINPMDGDAVKLLLDTVYTPHMERYGKLVGNVFVGFFSDEPSFGNLQGFDTDAAVGRKRMALPWCGQMPAMLANALGKNWQELLPLLWTDSTDERQTARMRLCYMDAVTRLYQKNFSEQIGSWCAARGLAYIGHVVEDNGAHTRLGCGAGHYFRALSGQHMAGIDVIGGQICVGGGTQVRHGFGDADGAFFHHALVPMAASAAMLDPKKQGRLLCELYGAYGWTTGVRDMKWITDFLVCRGVNRLVPHAFSMAEYPDPDCPPHFYARGHNPQFEHFGMLMRYADKLCRLFSGGVGGARAAILYPAECDWMNASMPLEAVARELDRTQTDFWVLPEDMLGCSLPKDVAVDLLIVGKTRYLTAKAARTLLERAPESCLFVDERPVLIPEADAAEETALLSMLARIPVVSLRALGEYCRGRGLCAGTAAPAFEKLHIYRYKADNQWRHMLFNESATDVFDGTVALTGGETLHLRLCPYESAVYMDGKLISGPVPPRKETALVSDISHGWRVSLAAADGDFGQARAWEALLPVSDAEPRFAGRMRYEKAVTLTSAPGSAVLAAEHVYETASVYVDGIRTDTRLTPPYRFSLGDALHAGENFVCVEVVCPPARDVLRYEGGPFGPQRSVLEPTGMFGTVSLEILE